MSTIFFACQLKNVVIPIPILGQCHHDNPHHTGIDPDEGFCWLVVVLVGGGGEGCPIGEWSWGSTVGPSGLFSRAEVLYPVGSMS